MRGERARELKVLHERQIIRSVAAGATTRLPRGGRRPGARRRQRRHDEEGGVAGRQPLGAPAEGARQGRARRARGGGSARARRGRRRQEDAADEAHAYLANVLSSFISGNEK